MLTPRKKFSRKELHKDPLLGKIAAASEMAQTHKQKLMTAATGVLVLAALVYGYISYRSDRNDESINKLAAVEQIYFSGDYREAIRRLEKYCAEYEVGSAARAEGLGNFIDAHVSGHTKGGGIAAFYLANAYYHTDQFDFALEWYKTYADDYGDNELFTIASMMGIAACYEGQNKYQDAAEQYTEVIGQSTGAGQKAEGMMSLARCHKILNQSEKAREWYAKVVKEFPESMYARDAKTALDELGG